jgi:Zn-dependent peptidase ImmA (M78 family)
MVRRIKKIREIVGQLLQNSMIMLPSVDVEAIARNQHIEIHKEDLKGISGFIYKEGNQVTIGVNKNDPPNRQRFTIAHELGHFFLHSENPLHVDKSIVIKLRDHVSSEAVNAEEIEANAFAAELLMPAKMIEEDFRHVNKALASEEDELDGIISKMASDYRVSKQAMTLRLSNLGYFQETL